MTDTTGKKKAILVLTMIYLVFIGGLTLLSSTLGPGEGGAFLFLALPILAGHVFFLVYFIILAMRYAREKSAMHQLDRIEFFILLIFYLFALGLPTLHNLGIGF